jgi:cell division protein FtsB
MIVTTSSEVEASFPVRRKRTRRTLLTFRLILALILLSLPTLYAVESDSGVIDRLDGRVSKLEREQSNFDREVRHDTKDLKRRINDLEDNPAAGIGFFASGILCALWAQFTRRSAWLWFFFGLFLAPIALIAMVWKNARGLKSGELRYWTGE